VKKAASVRAYAKPNRPLTPSQQRRRDSVTSAESHERKLEALGKAAPSPAFLSSAFNTRFWEIALELKALQTEIEEFNEEHGNDCLCEACTQDGERARRMCGFLWAIASWDLSKVVSRMICEPWLYRTAPTDSSVAAAGKRAERLTELVALRNGHQLAAGPDAEARRNLARDNSRRAIA
jgi:hypothetical protein